MIPILEQHGIEIFFAFLAAILTGFATLTRA